MKTAELYLLVAISCVALGTMGGCSCSDEGQPTKSARGSVIPLFLPDERDGSNYRPPQPEAGLPKADTTPPGPGWKLWPYTPDDCALFVPRDMSTVQPLQWKTCPFQTNGCQWAKLADAPCMPSGGGVVSAVNVAGSQFLAYPESTPGVGGDCSQDWIQAVVERDGAVVAAWKTSVAARACWIGVPLLGLDGRASDVVIRKYAENAPLAFVVPVTDLMKPAPIQRFGPPDAALLPTMNTNYSSDLLVIRESYGRFTVRDLATGATWRPEPSYSYNHIYRATAIGRSVYYWAYNTTLGSIWRWSLAPGASSGRNDVLLGGAPYSYDGVATDGVDLVWNRSKDQLSAISFQTVELWASAVSASNPGKLAPHRIATLPTHFLSRNSVGEGWVAANLDFRRVYIYSLRGKPARRLPIVQGIEWGADQQNLLAISGGRVWVGVFTAPGTVTHIARFDIDKLPLLDPGDGGVDGG